MVAGLVHQQRQPGDFRQSAAAVKDITALLLGQLRLLRMAAAPLPRADVNRPIRQVFAAYQVIQPGGSVFRRQKTVMISGVELQRRVNLPEIGTAGDQCSLGPNPADRFRDQDQKKDG